MLRFDKPNVWNRMVLMFDKACSFLKFDPKSLKLMRIWMCKKEVIQEGSEAGLESRKTSHGPFGPRKKKHKHP